MKSWCIYNCTKSVGNIIRYFTKWTVGIFATKVLESYLFISLPSTLPSSVLSKKDREPNISTSTVLSTSELNTTASSFLSQLPVQGSYANSMTNELEQSLSGMQQHSLNEMVPSPTNLIRNSVLSFFFLYKDRERNKRKWLQIQEHTKWDDGKGYQSTNCTKQNDSTEVAKKLFLLYLEPDEIYSDKAKQWL